MRMTAFLVFACATALLFVSCKEPPATSSPVAVATPQAPTPFCDIESGTQMNLAAGVDIWTCELKAYGLKQLTARLIVANDGKAETASEVSYRWDVWGPGISPSTGRMVLLIQDGETWGVKGKRLPLMNFDFKTPTSAKHDPTQPSPVSQMKNEGFRKILVEGDLRAAGSWFPDGTKRLERRGVICGQVFSQIQNMTPITYSGSMERVVAESAGGRTIVAVEIEWEPQP